MRKSLLLLALVVIISGCQGQVKSSIGKLEIMEQKMQLSALKLEKPGFVLIQELTADKQIGPAVGLSPFAPQGETKNLLIFLSSIKSGTTYRVSLRLDNGDRTFIASDDAAAMNGKKEVFKDITAP